MTTEFKHTVQITRDGPKSRWSYVRWPSRTPLTYSEDEWFDMDCRDRGDPILPACVPLVVELIGRELHYGERVIVEIRTI